MGFIFSKFSKLGSGASPSPNPSPSVAETNQLFQPTHSFWAGYATAVDPNIPETHRPISNLNNISNVYSYSVYTPMFQHLQTLMPCNLCTINHILRKLLSIIRLIISIGLLIRVNLRYSSHLI